MRLVEPSSQGIQFKREFNVVLFQVMCIDPVASTTAELISVVAEMTQNQMPIR